LKIVVILDYNKLFQTTTYKMPTFVNA